MEVVYKVLPGIMKKFKANKYNMLRFNCNHFSDEFLRKISKDKHRLPAYLNRPAYIGGKVHCLVPMRYLIVIPPGTSEEEVQMACMKKWDVVDSKKSGLKSIPQDDLDESPDESSDGEETILSDEDQDNLIL
jgi:hypothetical protein